MEQFANEWLNESLLELEKKDEVAISNVTLHHGVPYYLEIEKKGDSLTISYRGCVRWTNLLLKEEMVCGTVK